MFQTGHVIEVVTKLFLVVQNAVGKAPEVNITTEWVHSTFNTSRFIFTFSYAFRFEANFGSQTVTFTFKCMGLPEVQPGQIRVIRKGNKMEVLVWRRAKHILKTSVPITAIRICRDLKNLQLLLFLFVPKFKRIFNNKIKEKIRIPRFIFKWIFK